MHVSQEAIDAYERETHLLKQSLIDREKLALEDRRELMKKRVKKLHIPLKGSGVTDSGVILVPMEDSDGNQEMVEIDQ